MGRDWSNERPSTTGSNLVCGPAPRGLRTDRRAYIPLLEADTMTFSERAIGALAAVLLLPRTPAGGLRDRLRGRRNVSRAHTNRDVRSGRTLTTAKEDLMHARQ